MKEIILQYVPVIANFCVSILYPIVFSKVVKKIVKNRVDTISSNAELKEIKKDLKECKKNILEMRGKLK